MPNHTADFVALQERIFEDGRQAGITETLTSVAIITGKLENLLGALRRLQMVDNSDPLLGDPTPIEDLDFHVRTYNCLKREGVHTVGDLARWNEAELLNIQNLGEKGVREILETLFGIRRLKTQDSVDKAALDNLRKEAGEPVNGPDLDRLREVLSGQAPDPVEDIPDSINGAIVTLAKEKPVEKTPISVLNLRSAINTALEREKIGSVEELEKLTDEQLRDIRNIGVGSADEIRVALAKYKTAKTGYTTETSVDWLGLGTLVTNLLIRGGVNYVEELEQLSDEQLDDIDYIGPKRIGEIRAALKEYRRPKG